jgi:hypothetical protein
MVGLDADVGVVEAGAGVPSPAPDDGPVAQTANTTDSASASARTR